MRLTRRHWLGLCSLAAAGGCGPKKGTAYPGYALIATSGDKSLAAVDLSTFQTLRPIPLDAEPEAVLSGAPEGGVYVLTPKTGTVHLVTAHLEHAGERKLSDELTEVRLAPDRERLLATSPEGPVLLEADAASLAVATRYPLSAPAEHLDVFGPYAAVATGKAGVVELINRQTGERWRAQVGSPAGLVRFRGDGKLLLAAVLGARELVALSVPGLNVVARLPLAMEPEHMCSNSDGGQFFVSGKGMDGVAIVFPYRVLEVDQTVLAGRDPGVMMTSANPDLLFVGSESGSDVCILNIETRKVVGIVDVGQRPTYITLTPDNQYALILNEASNDMAVIRVPAIRLNPAIVISKSGASLFTILPVGAKPVHAAVIPKRA